MRVALFCHSVLSGRNNPHAHFQRGIATELLARRHDVRVFEPRREEHGARSLDAVKAVYPRLRATRYDLTELDLDEAFDGVDVAIVHESNEPELVGRVGEWRKRAGTKVKALFHDTDQRSSTFDLSGYDGVLACSAARRETYLREGWAQRVWTWHQAADPRVFFPHPMPPSGKEADVVWIGSWDDDLEAMLLGPVKAAGLRAVAYGANYSDQAKELLARNGVEHRGWLPNFQVPEAFARFKMTVHVARRMSIRIFEALASGIPLVSGPWDDVEGLFTAGADYLRAQDAAEMETHMRDLANDASRRSELARHGRRTILARHTCAHRVDELIAIAVQLGVRVHRPAFLEVAI